MPPPVWLDDTGRRRSTRPCPKCGREAPVLRLRYEHLRMNGWKPMKTMHIARWCGHGQEFVQVPEAEGYWRLVPVWGGPECVPTAPAMASPNAETGSPESPRRAGHPRPSCPLRRPRAARPGPAAAPLRPLLDREPVAAQDGPGQRAIAVLTLAFAPVKRAIPRVRLGPAGEAAFRPPASRGEGADGTAFVRPMRPPANPGTGRGRACSGWAKGERGHGDRGPGAARIDER